MTTFAWEDMLKAERLVAARKQGRELAKRADKNFEHGRITGICATAAFLVSKDRPDIAKIILSHFMVDREKAEGALQSDKRTRDIDLAYLTKSGVWSTSLLNSNLEVL